MVGSAQAGTFNLYGDAFENGAIPAVDLTSNTNPFTFSGIRYIPNAGTKLSDITQLSVDYNMLAGAFTGANKSRQGKIAMAHRGTLFLDEIESMSLAIQGKMLRVLEDRKVRRLGGSQSVDIAVRVIAASNVSLKNMVSAGTMRADFYYRINAVPIHLIPLRERFIDIPLLVQNFLHNHPFAKSKNIVGVSNKVLARFMEYSWPGNVRELQNALECAILLAGGRIIEDVKLPETAHDQDREKSEIASSASLRRWLREKERIYLAQPGPDRGRAARRRVRGGGLRPGQHPADSRGGHRRPRGGRPDPPARRVDRERHQLLAAQYPGEHRSRAGDAWPCDRH
jgi:hypothetical protein